MAMTVMLHVFIALTSIGLTTLAYVSPSRGKLRVAYGLMALTLASGSYLVMSAPAHMAQACVTGVAYLAIVTAIALAARRKLMAAERAA